MLVKGGNLNRTNLITKLVTGLLTSKVIAVFIGVEGMALIGNLRNFMGSVQTFSVLGFYDVLVKTIAEVKNDVHKLSQALSTAYYLGFFATVLTSFFCYYNANLVNDFLFTSHYNFDYIIKAIAFALPFYAINMFSFAIMNGFLKYKFLFLINIIGQLLGFFVTLLLIYQNNIDGALLSVVIAPALVLFITIVGVLNRRSLVSSLKLSNISFGQLKSFAPYASMALASTIAIPMITIVIRNYITTEVGIKEAGHWEAMQRLSDYYLMAIKSLIAFYLLPRFREIGTKTEFRKEVFYFYKKIMPAFGLALLLIYLLRSFLVPLVFSDAFKPTQDLFLWQLLGDFIKVLSLVLAYQFVVKKMFTHYIIIQTFLVVVMYLSSTYLIDVFGVQGAVIGHFVSYLMYYGIVLLLFGNSLFRVLSEPNADR